MDDAEKEKRLLSHPQKGSNQIAVRSYNERLVLQLIREHGRLTKAEATRATGLSANAASVIFRALESEGLVLREEPIRGRIGQPSTPLRINPEAHHYVTLRIGRRSLELAVVNFAGQIVSRKHTRQPFPTPKLTLDFLDAELAEVLAKAKVSRESVAEMAVVMPYELWSWTEEFGAPKAEMEAWRRFDPVKEVQNHVPWPVVVENDATAACRAELIFGSHTDKRDWIYFFVGTFIGGGVVLNSSVFSGRRGNAGGFGPMRVPDSEGGDRLVDHASLVVLEREIAAKGGNPFDLYDAEKGWHAFEDEAQRWIGQAATNLAHAIVSSLAIIDFEAVVIDGVLPEAIKKQLVDQIRQELENSDLQGVHMPRVEAGQIGADARTRGGAATIINAKYMNNQNISMN